MFDNWASRDFEFYVSQNFCKAIIKIVTYMAHTIRIGFQTIGSRDISNSVFAIAIKYANQINLANYATHAHKICFWTIAFEFI